jgi:hypothetical protein
MRYIILSLLLCGCSTAPKPLPPAPVENQNKERDKYIQKVEAVVSDSASALTAVVPTLGKGTVKEIVESQVTRLSGVSKPSVVKVEEFTRIIKQNDSKAVQQDKKEASKVEAETDALYAMVEQKDYEIMEAHARADAEFKQKVLWKFSTAGLGLFVVGLMAVAFTPFKKNGAVVMAGGSLAMASLWVFDSTWFTWIVGGSIGTAVLCTTFVLIKKLTSRTPLESHPQKQESADQHPHQ